MSRLDEIKARAKASREAAKKMRWELTPVEADREWLIERAERLESGLRNLCEVGDGDCVTCHGGTSKCPLFPGAR